MDSILEKDGCRRRLPNTGHYEEEAGDPMAQSTGLHNNKTWLFDRYCKKRLSVKKIAKEAGVSEVSVYASIKKFNLKR